MDYLKSTNTDIERRPNIPKIKLGPTAETNEGSGNFVNLSSGHNTFRPDIYRTSEGYLN